LFSFGREVEGDELVAGEVPSKGGGLAGLAGASQYRHGTGPCRPSQAGLNFARYPQTLNIRYERILCKPPLTHEIALAARQLPLHQDPADRILAATAQVLDLTLATADERLLGLGDIRTLANR